MDELGYDGYLEYHLDYEAINDGPLYSLLSGFITLNYTAIFGLLNN